MSLPLKACIAKAINAAPFGGLIPVDCEDQEAFEDASAYGSDNVQAARARQILFP